MFYHLSNKLIHHYQHYDRLHIFGRSNLHILLCLNNLQVHKFRDYSFCRNYIYLLIFCYSDNMSTNIKKIQSERGWWTTTWSIISESSLMKILVPFFPLEFLLHYNRQWPVARQIFPCDVQVLSCNLIHTAFFCSTGERNIFRKL